MAHKINLDYLKQKEVEAQQRKSNREQGDLAWYDFANGQNRLRVLPPWSSEGLLGMEVFMHHLGRDQKILCLKGFKGSPFAPAGADCECPICEVLRELKDANVETDGMWARFSVYLNAIDRKTNNLCIVRFPGTLFDSFRSLVFSDWGDVTDPITGNDILIDKKGSGLDTKYNILPMRDRTPVFTKADGTPDFDMIENLLGNEEKQIPTKLFQLHLIWKYPKGEALQEMRNKAAAFRVFHLGTPGAPKATTTSAASGFSEPTSTSEYAPPNAPTVATPRYTPPPPPARTEQAPQQASVAPPPPSTPPPAQSSKPTSSAPPPPPKSKNVAEGRVVMPQSTSPHPTSTSSVPQQEVKKPDGSPNCWGKAHGFDAGICSKCAYEVTCKSVCEANA